MKKKILITGANGFIGSHLCETFADKGWQVYGLCRRGADLHFLEGIDVTVITGDLIEPDRIDFPPHLDVLVHNAAIADDNATARESRKGIYLLTRGLVEALRPVSLKRFIYISTGLTIGYCGENITEDNPGLPTHRLPYARFKKMTEQYLLDEYRTRKFPVVILRPGDVYGPRDRTSSLPMLEGLNRGVPIIVGPGTTRFAYCYVLNLAQAVYLASTRPDLAGKTYTVTDGYDLTWGEFFRGFYREMGKKQRLYVPRFPVFLLAAVNQFISRIFPRYKPSVNLYRFKRITRDTTYDISDTVRELGYQPETDINHQVKKIVDWYKKEKRRKIKKKLRIRR